MFFDGIDEACDSNPVFSHVVQDEYLMGTMAVKYLKKRIEGKEVPKRYNVPYKVIRGERQEQE